MYRKGIPTLPGRYQMRVSRILVVVAGFAILFTASLASAGPWGAGPGWGMGPRGMMWSNLTPDQQRQVTSIRLDFLKKQEALRGEIGRKKIEFAKLANSPNTDERLMEKKRQEIWALQDKMRNEGRAMGTKIWAWDSVAVRGGTGSTQDTQGFGGILALAHVLTIVVSWFTGHY
jgi:Spy/CpxP family protein refolding chaperone